MLHRLSRSKLSKRRDYYKSLVLLSNNHVLSFSYKNRFVIKVTGSEPIGIPIICQNYTLPKLIKKHNIGWFEESFVKRENLFLSSARVTHDVDNIVKIVSDVKFLDCINN